MGNRFEYSLKEAPDSYHWGRDLVVLAGAVAMVSCIVLVALQSLSRVSGYLIAIFSVLLVSSLLCVLYILRWMRREFPSRKEFHEKLLPPKENPALLQGGLSVSISNRHYRADRIFSWVFAAIGLAILLSCGVMGMKSTPLLVLGAVMLTICVWSVARMRRIEVGPSRTSIEGTETGIILPAVVLEVTQASKLVRANQSEKELHWSDISEWVVDWGGSDSPDLYVVKLKSSKSVEVYRSVLRGKEIELLEYVRAAGIPVRLKDSVIS